MIEFYSSHMLARHVSDLTGPSSGAFYKLYLEIWYVVIRVLLDTSRHYTNRATPSLLTKLNKKYFKYQQQQSIKWEQMVITVYIAL